MERWQNKWSKVSDGSSLPGTAITALSVCNPQIYPNINRLLRILSTLPVSTATSERSFSTMKRLKTYLRSTMTESRLTSLALLAIHRERPVNVEKVIDTLARYSRRLYLIL